MRAIFAVTCLAAASLAGADAITVDGQRYEDVLIYTSDTLYYVVMPGQGEVMNVYRDEVDASSVSIVKDRSYRDRLREAYDQARGGGTEPGVAAQALADARDAAGAQDMGQSPSAPGTRSGAAPSAPGESVVITAPEQEGLGISASDLQNAAQALGVTLQPQGGGAMSGSNQDGSITISANGPASNLMSVQVSLQVPIMVQQQDQRPEMQMASMLGNIAPWIPEWLNNQQTQTQLMSQGSISETRGGIQVQVQGAFEGQQVNINASVNYVG